MTAARHYWNASCPLLSQPIERELLREPIRIILQCITDTAEKLKKKEVCIIFNLNVQTLKLFTKIVLKFGQGHLMCQSQQKSTAFLVC